MWEIDRDKNRQSQSARDWFSLSAKRQSRKLEERSSIVGLRNVGLHRARVSEIEAHTTRLGYSPANDAILRVYMECAQNAGNVGRCTTPQFHVHGDDL